MKALWRASQIAAKLCFQVFWSVIASHRKMQQRQPRSFEYFVHKRIAFLPVSALMTAIIQLDADEQPHGAGFTEHKINVLTDDPVQIGLPLRRLPHIHIENVYHPNFGTHGRPVADCFYEPVIKLQFSLRKQVRPRAERQKSLLIIGLEVNFDTPRAFGAARLGLSFKYAHRKPGHRKKHQDKNQYWIHQASLFVEQQAYRS